MKLRAAAIGAAVWVLSSAAVVGAAPEAAEGPTMGLYSLQTTEVRQAGGPAYWVPGAGYWGGWWAAPFVPSWYGPFGPYPLPQTANFFQTPALGSLLFGQSSSGLDGLAGNPAAPGASLTLAQLQALGLGTQVGNSFVIAGSAFPLVPGTTLGSTSLAALLGFPNPFFAPTPFTFGAFGLGLSR
ncbi:MAG TPA: hypothetical protein VKZ60_16235 [Chloroflexota bacterium]|jgi:hypothetical protein|nr:hypothetical protein [Chloroflexota bacterium]